MHSALALALTALLATAAIAKPLAHQQFHEKRQDVVLDVVTDVVYATAVVTQIVTANAVADVAVATPTSSSTSSTIRIYSNNWGWHSWTWGRGSTTSTTAAASSTVVSTTPAAVSTTIQTVASSPTSTYVAPVPTSTYVAPTSTYVAPSTTPATTTASSTVAPIASSSALSSYQDIALYHHNIHRSNHSAPSATWNTSLVTAAQEWASQCSYAHNTNTGGGGYGQNIAAGVHADNVSAIITNLFYNGEVNWYVGQYGLDNPDFTNFENWGHFSQIVWAESTTVGCYTQDCSAGGLAGVGQYVAPYFTVCNYYPPGNMGGEYGANIGKPTENWSADWNTGL